MGCRIATILARRSHFAPIDTNVAVTLTATDPALGPTHTQVMIFEHIVDRYEEILNAVSPLLNREHDEARAVDDSLPPTVRFRLEELSIPEAESDSMVWEMRFYCDDGGDLSYNVQMCGWRPTGEILAWD